MAWLSALFKALLEWFSSEAKKDTKARDADDTPQNLKDAWRRRIEEQEAKSKAEKTVPKEAVPQKAAPKEAAPKKKALSFWERQLKAEVRKQENEEDTSIDD